MCGLSSPVPGVECSSYCKYHVCWTVSSRVMYTRTPTSFLSYNRPYTNTKPLLCGRHKGAAFLSSGWNQNLKIHKRRQNAPCWENHSTKAAGNRLAMYFKPLFKCLGHDSGQTSGWKLHRPSLWQPSSWEKRCFWGALLGNQRSKSSAPVLRLHGTPLALWTFWLLVYTDDTGKVFPDMLF